MRPMTYCILAATLHLAGCATKPELITAIPVSQARYSDMSCAELRLELDLVTQRLNMLSERQRANRTRDGWLNVLVLPGLGAATSNQEGAIAQAKGEMEAIQREHLRCEESQPG